MLQGNTCITGGTKKIQFSVGYNVKARYWKPPGHYLCIPASGRPDCVISIKIGVNDEPCRNQSKSDEKFTCLLLESHVGV